ncbi:MAG: GrpB family protein [Clostridia bacterium]|nr:GrpB family protein [Clostridia bacterium]
MSLEELWQLFPIILTEHRPEWVAWYAEEERLLAEVLPAGAIARIGHIGSTAIGGIWAKPIVDILVEAAEGADWPAIRTALCQRAGYICMSEAPGRMSFNKGYTPDGFAERVFHLHLRAKGDHDELYFRDYLNDHPDVAREYEQMKLALWREFEHDRDGYTERKAEFVRRWTREARRAYAGRY